MPRALQSGPVSYNQVARFLENWSVGEFDPVVVPQVNAVTKTEEVKINNLASVKQVITTTICNRFGSSQLFPEQYDTYLDIIKHFSSGDHGVLQNGSTGSGKTYVAAALFHKYGVVDKIHEQGLNKFRTTPFLYITRKTVVRQTQEVFAEFGLSNLMREGKLLVVPYSHLSSSKSMRYVTKEFNGFTNEWELQWHLTAVPFVAMFDECQGLYSPKTLQTKAFYALLEASQKMPCKTVLFSATPFDTVDKAHAVVASFRKPFTYSGRKFSVTCYRDWEGASVHICDDPKKSNGAAMSRLREAIKDNICEIANVRWPARARNRTLVVDFENEEAHNLYKNAFEVYKENIAKLGRSVDNNPLAEFMALNVFSKAVEPLRGYAMVKAGLHTLNENKAVVHGVRFKCTATDLVFRYLQAGYKREDITIIWGGGADFDEDNVFTDEQFKAYTHKLINKEPVSKSELSKLKRTILFREEMLMSGTNREDTFNKYQTLSDLDMTGSQSSDKRWEEIKKFQSGKAKIAIFTIAAGGVGLSLDRNKPELLERVLFGGPCWSGPDYKQMLGRLVRRATQPGYVDQYLCCMRGTMEEYSLVPVLGRKLSNMKEIGSSGIDPTEVLLKDDRIESEEITLEQLTKIAESDDSQLGINTEEDEDDE